ncbi:integrase catalytic domain-containing protein [Trichonephila clavipes]|uniref:Integrase catalytic domain-containing protein n=1 Tax=Trichonephila clavipes TaxID=2585209 RepID=A0A8X6S2E7_TRICX|nr:integrase catalytic domain-containing protein [Trichonephila clavipes]
MIETSIISRYADIFVDHLRNTMRNMNPVTTSNHEQAKFYVNLSLKTCSHVFLRVDSGKPPLYEPYTGPHKVFKRTVNILSIDLNSLKSSVSIDRVKLAYLIPSHKDKTPTLPAEKKNFLS